MNFALYQRAPNSIRTRSQDGASGKRKTRAKTRGARRTPDKRSPATKIDRQCKTTQASGVRLSIGRFIYFPIYFLWSADGAIMACSHVIHLIRQFDNHFWCIPSSAPPTYEFQQRYSKNRTLRISERVWGLVHSGVLRRTLGVGKCREVTTSRTVWDKCYIRMFSNTIQDVFVRKNLFLPSQCQVLLS